MKYIRNIKTKEEANEIIRLHIEANNQIFNADTRIQAIDKLATELRNNNNLTVDEFINWYPNYKFPLAEEVGGIY